MKKKLNNKGFTLVELLATLVIIIAITSIAMTTISASLERSKNKKEEAQNKLYASAAKLYISSHRGNIIKDQCCISTDILQKEGYLDKNDEIKGCISYKYADKESSEESNDETAEQSENEGLEQKGKRIYEVHSNESGNDCLEKEDGE